MPNEEKEGKSEIKSPSLSGMDLLPKLGGMPKKLDADQIIKVNHPDDRSPAPGSFRPDGKRGENEND